MTDNNTLQGPGYILNLAGWYPSDEDAYNGDFVQRHAMAIALFEKVIVFFAIKSEKAKTIIIDKRITGNLTEYICYYPQTRMASALSSHYFYFKVFKKVVQEIIEANGLPKLVHVNVAWKAGLGALYLKRKYKLKYVITEHWSIYQSADPHYIKKNKALFFLIRRIFKNMLHFLPVTNNLAITCNNLFKLKTPCTIIENVVNTELFYPIENKKTKTRLLHISSMIYPKNVPGLLKVIAEVAGLRNDFELVLIGTCPEPIREMIKDNAALNKVTTIVGNISYAEVASYTREGDALILFSRYESLPCVILEALCCGLPVVATDVGGISEVITEANGILVPSEDEAALKAAIVSILDNIELYDKNSIALDAIGKYSFPSIGLKYRDAYRRILNQKDGY